jgi:hypothetical protein
MTAAAAGRRGDLVDRLEGHFGERSWWSMLETQVAVEVASLL